MASGSGPAGFLLASLFLLAGCGGLGDPATLAGDDPTNGTAGVNLVSARDISCASDPQFLQAADNGADLIVTIRSSNLTLLQAGSANVNAPEFGVFLPLAPGGHIQIEVADDEGDGASVPCDVAAGPGRIADVLWDGHARTVDLQGDGPGSVAVRLELGFAPKLLSEVHAAEETPNGATIAWTPLEKLDSVEVLVSPGKVSSATRTASSLGVGGLCDGMAYQARVIAVAGRWHIGQALDFALPNEAPAAPRVLSAHLDRWGTSVAWENPSPHDTDRFEVYAGPAGFSPDDRHLRAVDRSPGVYWDERQTFQPASGDAEVVIRTLDDGGLTTDSTPFAIGDGDVKGTTFGMHECQPPGSAPSWP
ncbi:MAG: hypothetical protein V4510_00885 [bacterium]